MRGSVANGNGDLTVARTEMVEHQLRERGIRSAKVLDAMAKVPIIEKTAEKYREAEKRLVADG